MYEEKLAEAVEEERDTMHVEFTSQLEEQVCLIYAGTNGYLDILPVPSVKIFAENLQEYLTGKDTTIIDSIKESKKLSPETESLLKQAILKIQQETLA